MERFEDALKGLAITDVRTREKIAPFLNDYLAAAQRLQRVLTPLDASVHGALSRANTKRGSPVTSVHWISVYDRVGLFDVDDSNVARLVDAALRYVWRKEAADALIAAVGWEGDRIMARSRRLQEGVFEPEGDTVDVARTPGDAGLPRSHLMTLPALRARIAFSAVRPPICTPNSSALSSAKAVIAAVAASPNPASLCRVIAFRACTALQTFLIARAGLTEATLAGETALAPGDGGHADVVAVNPVGGAAGTLAVRGVNESSSGAGDGAAGDAGHTMAGSAVGDAAGGDTEGAAGSTAGVAGRDAVGDSGDESGGEAVGEAGSHAGLQSGRHASSAAGGDAGDAAGGDASGNVRGAATAGGEAVDQSGDNAGGEAGGQSGGNAGGEAVGQSSGNAGGEAGGQSGGDACGGVGGESDGGADYKAGGRAFGTGASPATAVAAGGAAGEGGGESAVGTDGQVASDAVGAAACGPPAQAPGRARAEAAGGTGDGAGGDAAPGATTALAVVADAGTASVPPGGGGSVGDKNAGSSAPALQDDATDAAAASAPHAGDGAAASNSSDAKDAGEVEDTRADPAPCASMSRSTLVLGYLVAYLRSTALPTWKSPRPGKAPAPAGTMANPTGTLSVEKNRSLWCPRVRMTGIKQAFDVPALASRRLKLGSVDDVVVITAITVFKNKGIADIIAVLLLLCSAVDDMPRIIAETLEASFEARPARHSSLVLSGLDVQPEAGTAGSVRRQDVGCGEGPATAAAEAATATDTLPPANNDNESRENGAPGDGAVAPQDAGVVNSAGAPSGATPPNHSLGNSGGSNEANQAGAGGGASSAGGAGTGVGSGAGGDGDGIQENANVSVQAAYIMRAIRAAADKRASRLAVRRAVRRQNSIARDEGSAATTGARPPAGGRKRRTSPGGPSAQAAKRSKAGASARQGRREDEAGAWRASGGGGTPGSTGATGSGVAGGSAGALGVAGIPGGGDAGALTRTAPGGGAANGGGTSASRTTAGAPGATGTGGSTRTERVDSSGGVAGRGGGGLRGEAAGRLDGEVPPPAAVAH